MSLEMPRATWVSPGFSRSKPPFPDDARILHTTCSSLPSTTELPLKQWLGIATWTFANLSWAKRNGVWQVSYLRSYMFILVFFFLCYWTNLLNIRFSRMALFFFHTTPPAMDHINDYLATACGNIKFLKAIHSALILESKHLITTIAKWTTPRSIGLCHVPSRFHHIPNILEVSAKSRDFTIQEWTKCFLTSPPLTVQSHWPHLILSPTTKQIRPHLIRHFLHNPHTTQISPYNSSFLWLTHVCGWNKNCGCIIVADTSTPAAYVFHNDL